MVYANGIYASYYLGFSLHSHGTFPDRKINSVSTKMPPFLYPLKGQLDVNKSRGLAV